MKGLRGISAGFRTGELLEGRLTASELSILRKSMAGQGRPVREPQSMTLGSLVPAGRRPGLPLGEPFSLIRTVGEIPDSVGPEPITRLLRRAGAGDEAARSELFRQLYDELHRRAQRRVGAGAGSIGPTEMVHECFLRMTASEQADWRDRGHFLSVASTAMRHVAIDRFRRRKLEQLADDEPEPGEGAFDRFEQTGIDLLELGTALEELERRDATMARAVDLRFFTGLPMSECAIVLDVPLRTLERRWEATRAWLYARLK